MLEKYLQIIQNYNKHQQSKYNKNTNKSRKTQMRVQTPIDIR